MSWWVSAWVNEGLGGWLVHGWMGAWVGAWVLASGVGGVTCMELHAMHTEVHVLSSSSTASTPHQQAQKLRCIRWCSPRRKLPENIIPPPHTHRYPHTCMATSMHAQAALHRLRQTHRHSQSHWNTTFTIRVYTGLSAFVLVVGDAVASAGPDAFMFRFLGPDVVMGDTVFLGMRSHPRAVA